jgi:hypothetical protein
MKHMTFLAAMATAATVATGATASSVDVSIIEAEWFDAVGGSLGNTIDNSNPNKFALNNSQRSDFVYEMGDFCRL